MKKRLIYLSVFAIFIGLFGCSSKSADLSEYKQQVQDSQESIMDEVLLIGNMGVYEANYWNSLIKFGGTINYDHMSESGFEWLEENSDSDKEMLANQYESIKEQYAIITATDHSEDEVAEIERLYKEMFDTFNSYYKLVTEPSGSYKDFVLNSDTYFDAITANDEELKALLGESDN